MDNKITKKRINDHLEYDWFLYLIIIIASVALCWFVFSQINQTRDYEDVNFFVSCYDSFENGYETRVKNEMNSSSYLSNKSAKYGKNVLRDITFESQDPLGNQYGTLLQTHGVISSDVLILGERGVMSTAADSFLELTDELLLDYLLPDDLTDPNDMTATVKLGIDDLDYYYAGEEGAERRYGIKVSGFSRIPFEMDWRKVTSYKNKYAEEEEENQPDDAFYLVINKQSVNIGKFGRKSKDKNAQALYCVNRFIKYYR